MNDRKTRPVIKDGKLVCRIYFRQGFALIQYQKEVYSLSDPIYCQTYWENYNASEYLKFRRNQTKISNK